LLLSNIAITGANANQFKLSNPCGTTVASDTSCILNVSFAPTQAGTAVANISFTDNAAGSPQTMALNGTGVVPVTLSATSLVFPATTVGMTSASDYVTLSNTGTATLSISSIAVTGTNASSFVFANNCGTTLAVGANCSIHGHFGPTTGGTATAAVTITDSASSSPQTIALSGTGLVPVVQLEPSTLPSFPATNVGQTNTETVTVVNSGAGTLTLSSIAITGANASQFKIFGNCGAMPIASGTGCTFNVGFAPTKAGAAVATLSLTDNAAGSPQTLALSGTGVVQVTLSATSLTFPATTVGLTSASDYVTLTNTGTATLTFTSIVVSGTNATEFDFANSCGTTLAVGANCSIHGHFAPSATGSATAAVTITDNAANSPQTIALSGTGVPQPVTLSATNLSFGSVDVGVASASQQVTVTNTGSAALTISGIALTGTNASSFAIGTSCGTSLAVGANCTIHGHFQPTANGALTAAITITDSAATSPQSIALSGTGLPAAAVTLSATSLGFAATTVGASSGPEGVTMTNSGTVALTITSIAVTGTDASSFVFANSCGTSLAVGANCTIHGHFAPVATGVLTATIKITDSATGSPQSIALSGTGH